MPESELIERQRRILADSARLLAEVSDRHGESELAARLVSAEREAAAKRQEIVGRRDAELAKAESEHQAEVDRVTNAARKATDEIESTYRQTTEQANAEWQTEEVEAERVREDAHFEVNGVYDAGKSELKTKYGDLEAGTDPTAQGIETRRKETKQLLTNLGQGALADQPGKPLGALPANIVPQQAIEDAFKVADAKLADLRQVKRPKLAMVFVLFLLLGGGIAAGVGVATKWNLVMTPAAGVVGGAVLAMVIWIAMRSSMQGKVAAAYQPLAYALDYAEVARKRWQQMAGEAYRKESAALDERRKRDDAQTDKTCKDRIAAAVAKRDQILAKANEKHSKQLAELSRRKDAALEKAEAQIKRLREEIPARYAVELRTHDEQFQRATAEGRQALEATKKRRLDHWHQGVERLRAEAADIERTSGEIFPDWQHILSDGWQAPVGLPPVTRLGEWRAVHDDFVERKQVEEDTAPVLDDLALNTRDDDAADGEALRLPDLRQPALVTFPEHSSLLFKAQGKARDRAIEAMQAAMLRLATTIPPGKARFVVIDPIGLGQNFAAFMHLGDYDEQLIGARIWTESQQIEQRLADLTEQMEVVIQKYLRNEFETIEEYNAAAGEVAEPFRFLVIANFPANFSDAACRRLVSIVSSGPRCGVHTLISVDTKQPMPQGFKLSDLESHCVNFVWQNEEEKFVWKEPDFGRLPLALDKAPSVDAFTGLVKRVGAAAKDASRVEVPFSFIAPKPEEWWKSDTRKGIQVALGPAGATKRQNLELGRGTSQHVLVAGKTGSGKSTLLHTLITNLAITYSPQELELYLIDFKKGVEFKTYATYRLPHARVVSVESDREFGLSVLQRLDAELRSRGEMFRDSGAQDVAGYRRNTGKSLPRIMLIIDEFQEFFVEDDKLAQEVGLMFDRLVRQGRAFGMHVLLGSQTLGGAYSLARTTLGQMGVRIALQCSDADAHLILSEENSAARLLSRPGEAIYNDAGGLPDANHPFQVAYLPDEEKERWHQNIQKFAKEHNGSTEYPLIVFEGNVPGQLDHNPLLDALVRATDWPEGSNKPPTTWLGDPVAIKDPTAAILRRQSGGNLLLIGQNEQQALAILAAAEISLAAQFAPTRGDRPGMRLFVLDGTPPESATAGYLGRIARMLPHESQIGGVRDTAAVMNEVGAEVARRQASGETDAPAWYVFIHDIQRFRDLRKKEDDFGFSRMGEGEQVSPSQHLTNILREGPNLGVHVLTWCDSLTNLQRTFDRQALREFELRVLFQMSPNDSSALIDSPLASRLGEQRALFHSEEQGSVEKFRPYGQPPEEWLAWVERQLKSRMPPEPSAPAAPPPVTEQPASEQSARATPGEAEGSGTPAPVVQDLAMPASEPPMSIADVEPAGQNGNGADGHSRGDAAAALDESEAAS